MYICPYCLQDSGGKHSWNCPINKMRQPKPNYYHVYWLEIALENFKNQRDVVHTIDKNMMMKEFIKKWAREELSEIVEI